MLRTIRSSKLIQLLVKRNYSDFWKDSFISGNNSVYLTNLYELWKNDPASVPESWNQYFIQLELMSSQTNVEYKVIAPSMPDLAAAAVASDTREAVDYYNVMALFTKYRERGHFLADLDPLKLPESVKVRTYQSDRVPKENIFTKEQLEKTYLIPANTYIGKDKSLPLGEIIKRLKEAYTKFIGIEYSHIDQHERVKFIREKFESPNAISFSKQEKMEILQYLLRAHEFEAFLAKKWPPEKRFGLEGSESLIPTINRLIEKSVEFGCKSFIIGIAHRGRLNVLANICQTPLHLILMQFMEFPIKEKGSGDVKYHLGYTKEIISSKGQKYHVSMICNPSHLETVNPVVIGKTKADQFFRGDTDGKEVMAIIIHGDAATAGQGIVYETLNLSKLKFFNTMGVIHIVINNQIGFTTNPNRSRSSLYCTDVGKIINAPIFHVNGDKVEDCAYVGQFAAEYRHKFQADVVIDLIGYRKNGHNESDEPRFTQPFMYELVSAQTPTFHQYSKQLVDEKHTTDEEIKKTVEDYHKSCEEEFKNAEDGKIISLKDWEASPWDMTKMKVCNTGIDEDVLTQIAHKFYEVPQDFEVHKAIGRILKTREELTKNRMMDWAMGEAFAMGSLLKDGIHVRLTGEDAERGTFSHRHHVLHHQKKRNEVHIPLKKLFPGQAEYTISNSALCELGVLGFEFGYSFSDPNALIIWELQFGDFVNMAQAILDTFISSAEPKWVCQSGLVILMPHGLEGQGPEHSSSRVERFLQMCDDDEDVKQPSDPMKQLEDINWIVANCSMPANLTHILRRQICMPFRKPLILNTPKSMLRNPVARSSWDDVLTGTEFQRLIPDQGPASKSPDNVKKLIFCSGKVYFEIMALLAEKKLENQIAVARIEQICPFPTDLVKQECDKYPNAKIAFCQEEHKNQGPYQYVKPRLLTAIDYKKPLDYIGRGPAAAPASGNKIQYKQQVKKLKEDIIFL